MTSRQTTPKELLFILKTKGPQTATALAERLGITMEGARQHLTRLADDDLAAYEDRRLSVGRPKRYWVLTDTGHAQFPDSHSHLTVELLAAVRTEFGEAGLDKLITRRESDTLKSYRRELKGALTLDEKVKRLCAIRDREGYMAHCEKLPDGAWLLIENHCPICAAARSCQGFCRSELEVFKRVLGKNSNVERVDYLLQGASRCAYRISV